MKLSELQEKRVVSISDGSYIGEIIDVNITLDGNIESLVVEKSNQIATYTHDDKLTAFAYPASYGNLSQILDQNGFDISGSFSSTSYVYNSVQYKVYYANDKNTLVNFKISYKF